MIKVIFVLICVQLGHSYPDGAPDSVCTSMMPQHDVAPKQCQSKYIIQSERSDYNTNDIIRRILLIAKNANNQEIIGTWSATNSSVQTVACNGIKNSAITHSSSVDKTLIEVFWHVPSNIFEGNTIIKATIVKSYNEIYVDCFNITLTAKRNSATLIQPVLTNVEKDISTKTNTNITWSYDADTVTVTMTTGHVTVNEWRAIGFSLDEQMGDEYVFICQVSSAGEASLRRMHTKLGRRPPSPTVEDVTVLSAVYEDGHAICQFSFETTSEQADGEPAPIVINKNYHINFAAGILRTEVQIAKHNLTFITSKTYQLQNSETINLDESTATTAVSGASTSAPVITTTTASQASDVGVNISWTYNGGTTDVKMIISNFKMSQWLAIGFSLDDRMGEDHVFCCQHLADNTISLQRLYNPNGHMRPVLSSTITNPGLNFNVSRQRIENGIAYCDFTLTNLVDIRRRRRQNTIPELSQTVSYRPLIAIGNLDSSNTMMRHSSTSRTALSQNVLLNQQDTIIYNVKPTNPDSTSLMKAHGIIMAFTWMVLVSTGILVARYFKQSWSTRKICAKAVWFAIHRTIMTCAALLTLIAFVLILVYKKGQWVSQNSKREFIHSITGILVISFAIIQPFMALFRCNPDDRYRFIFNYVHAIVGFSAFLLSIVTIFLSMFFTQFNFQVNKEWAILVAWSCWLPIIFVIFEIIEAYFRKQSTTVDPPNSFDMNTHPGNGTVKITTIQMTPNVNKDRIKAVFLLFHIIFALALALALMILIAQSQ